MAFVVYEGHHPQEKEDPGFERSQKNRKCAEQLFGWLKQALTLPPLRVTSWPLWFVKLGHHPQENEDPGFEQSQKDRKSAEQVFGWLKQALTLPILPC